tara:strand:+ start:706 stop:3006 length:2301 start_codon:yes stop_codon:yes gene_type:complete
MSKSFDRNIERLKANQRSRSAQEQGITTAAAQQRGQYLIDHARDISSKLTPFSTALQKWKDEDIEKKIEEGKREREKARLENAKWLLEHGTEHQKQIAEIERAKKAGELAYELTDAEAQDFELQRLKGELLKRQGTSAYPDADRLSQLSPWQQVGYVEEGIRFKMLGFEDQLAHALQNSEEMITLGGIKFTPKEIASNNLAFPMKKHAVEILGDKIYRNLGLDRYSDEMLDRMKVRETITKAKDSQIAKYRERYNIESSMNTRAKAKLEWQRSEKDGRALQKLVLVNSNTVNTKGVLLGNTGGWLEAEKIITQEAISKGGTAYIDKIFSQPMPDSLARQVGAKPGTTYAQHWPGKVTKLKLAAQSGFVEKVNAEKDFLNSAATELTNTWKKEVIQNGPLSTARVNELKRQYAQLGQPVPSDLTKYETVSMQDQREDKNKLEALMASQNGRVTREQAESYNPAAVQELGLWEKIEKWEAADLKKFDTEKLIKASLDTTFTGMGVKNKEKSFAYVEAMKNAKADYLRKYNQYISYGHSAELANYWALHGKNGEALDANNQPIPNAEGVITEIKQNAENSKYVVTGQSIEKEYKPGNIRTYAINQAKKEIQETDGAILYNDTIGGEYGQRQLNSVMKNIEKYGQKGIWMDKGAIQYYRGIASGLDVSKTGGWWGVLDAQLKANGHPGLSSAGKRPEAVNLITGMDDNNEPVPDPRGEHQVNKRVGAALLFPSFFTNSYIMNTLKDNNNIGGVSSYDKPENQDPYLREGA